MSQIPRPQVMNETNAKSGSFTGYFRLTGIFLSPHGGLSHSLRIICKASPKLGDPRIPPFTKSLTWHHHNFNDDGL